LEGACALFDGSSQELEALLAELEEMQEDVTARESEVSKGGSVENVTAGESQASRGEESAPPEEGEDSRDRLFNKYMEQVEQEGWEVPPEENLFLGGSQELAEACGWGTDINTFFNIWAPQLSENPGHATEEGAPPLVQSVQEFTPGGSENFVEEWILENASREPDNWSPSSRKLIDDLLNKLPPSPSPSRKRPAQAKVGPSAKRQRLPGQCGTL